MLPLNQDIVQVCGRLIGMTVSSCDCIVYLHIAAYGSPTRLLLYLSS
jgi:hypothetical protein